MSDEEFDVYADLGGISEVAVALGVGIHRVKHWLERRDTVNCPQPVRELKMGHVYSIGEWQGWFKLWMATRAHKTYIRKADLLRFPE